MITKEQMKRFSEDKDKKYDGLLYFPLIRLTLKGADSHSKNKKNGAFSR